MKRNGQIAAVAVVLALMAIIEATPVVVNLFSLEKSSNLRWLQDLPFCPLPSAMLLCQISLVGIGSAILPARLGVRMLCAVLGACGLVMLGMLLWACGGPWFMFLAGPREGAGLVLAKGSLLVGVQTLVAFVGVTGGLAVWRHTSLRKGQYSLLSLLLFIGGVAVTLGVGRAFFSVVLPTLDPSLMGNERDFWTLGIVAVSNALVASAVFFWLFRHGWRIKLITVPLVAVTVAGILLAAGVALYATWDAPQAGIIATGYLILTAVQAVCVPLTLGPLRFWNVFGTAAPEG
jgi:hypothetical protein